MKLSTYYRLINWHIRSWTCMDLSKRPLPYKLMIQITNLCNSRCKNCLIWNEPVNHNSNIKEVTLEEILGVVEVLKNELIWIAITGGEPTLKKNEVIETIARAKKKCKKLSVVAFTTNGLLPKEALEIALGIKDLGLDSIVTISMDGDEKVHDHIRGVKGNFKLANETLKLLRDNGVKCHFGITIGQHNHDFVDQGYEGIAKNIKAITFTHLNGIYSFKGSLHFKKIASNIDKVLSLYKLNKLHEIIELIYLKISKKFFAKDMKKNLLPCTSMKSTIDLMADGSVLPCMFMPKIADANNFTSDSLYSEEALRILADIKKNNCPKCWMNCYAPHSIIYHPFKSLREILVK